MPRYFFNVHGESFANPDLVGRKLPDDEAARSEAHEIAKEVSIAEVVNPSQEMLWVEVVDEAQRPIVLLPVSEAPTEPTRLS